MSNMRRASFIANNWNKLNSKTKDHTEQGNGDENMQDDPYFINNKRTSKSMKGQLILPWNEIRYMCINWAAPYLDGCLNCSQSCNDPVIDKYDDGREMYYRCEDFEYKNVWLKEQIDKLTKLYINETDRKYKEKRCNSCDQKQTCDKTHETMTNCAMMDMLTEME